MIQGPHLGTHSAANRIKLRTHTAVPSHASLLKTAVSTLRFFPK